MPSRELLFKLFWLRGREACFNQLRKSGVYHKDTRSMEVERDVEGRPRDWSTAPHRLGRCHSTATLSPGQHPVLITAFSPTVSDCMALTLTHDILPAFTNSHSLQRSLFGPNPTFKTMCHRPALRFIDLESEAQLWSNL